MVEAVFERSLILSSVKDTESLAFSLSRIAVAGDVICLTGELGSGKTTFSRYFNKARALRLGINIFEIPSPTFTLVQVYEIPAGDIWHFDLFRIDHPTDIYELGIEDAMCHAICLIEWPEKLPNLDLSSRLDVEISFGSVETERTITLSGGNHWVKRLSGSL